MFHYVQKILYFQQEVRKGKSQRGSKFQPKFKICMVKYDY